MFWKILTVLALAGPLPALAWGMEGHEIVAQIALHDLTPAARAQVGALLGSDALLVHEANWADEIRDQRSATAPWHYVDIPLTAAGYDATRDCAQDNCVVAQIARDRRILADARASADAKREALRFLVHFVADIHQPLHATDNDDRGGNAVHVTLQSARTNLHHVWDAQVVDVLGADVQTIADHLEAGVTPRTRKAWEASTPADWANESHAIARDRIYPSLHGAMMVHLPRDYGAQFSPVTRIQLAKAGVRLAYILNTTLK